MPTLRTRTKSVDPSAPKATRTDTSERRDVPTATCMAQAAAVKSNKSKTASGVPVTAEDLANLRKRSVTARKLDAMPDRIDVRDWPYAPTLHPLPPELISVGDVPTIL